MKKILLIALALFSISATSTIYAEGLKIGVVHLSQVFDAYEKTKQLDAELKADTQTKMADAKVMRDAINSIQKQMENKMLSIDKRLDLKEQFAVAKLRYDMFRKKTMALAERQQILRISDVYKDIRATINAYAQEEGYDLVIRLQTRKQEHTDIKSLEQEMNFTSILYAGKRVTITQAITDKLNKAYTK